MSFYTDFKKIKKEDEEKEKEQSPFYNYFLEQSGATPIEKQQKPSQIAKEEQEFKEEEKPSILKRGADFVKSLFKKEERETFRDTPIVEFFAGEREGTPVPDEGIQEQAMVSKQQVKEDEKRVKQEIINYYKDSIKQDSKLRDVLADINVDNFDDYEKRLSGAGLGEYETSGTQEVGMGIFKRNQEVTKRDRLREQELWNQLKTLKQTDGDLDEVLGYVSANRGVFRTILESFKNFNLNFPSSAEYANFVVPKMEKETEAVKKLNEGKDLTPEDWLYLNSWRANAYNALVDKNFITQAGDVLAGSLGFPAEIALMAAIGGGEPVSKTAAAGFVYKVKNPVVRKLTEKILGNSVNMAIKSQLDAPMISGKTAQYMLPTADYEKWLSEEGEKGDVLEYIKKGDDENTAFKKAQMSTLIEYLTEGIGDYIDDAGKFVYKAFIGKFLQKRGIRIGSKSVTAIKDALSNNHINSIAGEVLEEEIGEPFLANLEDREYLNPLLTPEGRERVFVTFLGIGALRGMASVTDATLSAIRDFRAKNRRDSIDLEVEDGDGGDGGVAMTEPTETYQEEQTAEYLPEKSSISNITSTQNETVYRGVAGKVSEKKISFNNVLEVNGYQEQLLKDMAEQGNTKAQDILNNRTDFFVKADKLIKDTFAGQYDAIAYTNNNTGVPSREKVGKEYFDLKSGEFYALNEDTAKVYAKQRGREKKYSAKDRYAKKVSERTVKFRQLEDVAEKYGVSGVEKIIVNELEKAGDTNIRIERAEDGGMLLKSDKMKNINLTETEGDITIQGFKRADFKTGESSDFKGVPTNILKKIERYAFENDKSVSLYSVSPNAIPYWESQGYMVDKSLAVKGYEDLQEQFKGEPTRESIDRNVRDYVYGDPRGSKFRTNEDQLVPTSIGRSLTTKFLELPEIKGKNSLAWTFIDNLSRSNKVGLKAYELSVIQEVLNKDFAGQEKVNMRDFRTAVISKMLPLDIIETDTYSDYGMSSIGLDQDSERTYILNSNFEHGQSGHFSGDFGQTIPRNNVEIREINDGGVMKYAVIDKTIPLTEATVDRATLNLSESREKAETWIEEHTIGAGVRFMRKSGLFSHFRAGDVSGISHIVEIQSDAFQRGVGIAGEKKKIEDNISYYENELKIKQQTLESIEDTDENETRIKGLIDAVKQIEDRLSTLIDELNSLGEPTKEEQIFQTYKNIWHERTVREAINIKALEGFKKLRFPTPRTVAVIEGFSGGEDGNFMPYEIINSADPERLEAGDLIDYGGIEYTVMYADAYDIVVAPTEDVREFDINDFIADELNAKIEDAMYNYREIRELFGDLTTIKDVKRVGRVDAILKKLGYYKNKENDIKYLREKFANNSDVQHAKDLQKSIERHTEMLNLIKDGVIEKENITQENIHSLEFKDKLEQKYGMEHAFWNYIVNPYFYVDSSENSVTTISQKEKFKEVTRLTIRDLEGVIRRYKGDEQLARDMAEKAKNDMEKGIANIKAREKPTKEELSIVPKELLDQANNASYTVAVVNDWVLEGILERAAIESTEDTDAFDIDEAAEAWMEEESQNYNPDLEGIFSVVYRDGDQVYAIESDTSEQFSQPDEYEQASTIEDFDINKYDGEQKTVLEFYDRKIVPYLKKLRKDNLELIEDDNGYQWYETEITEADKEPPTAYRIKEDLEQVGITITDAQEKEIIKLNKKFFGDDSVKITEQILANNKALGSYSQKLIKILAGQANPKDTFYHEAVHKYIDVFLTKNEQIDLFTAAAKKYKTDDIAQVEERLAEDFIKYAKSREGLTGKIKHIFDKIINRVQSYLGNKNTIDSFYAELITPLEKKAAVKAKKKVTKTAQKKAEAPKVYGRGRRKVSTLGAGVESKAIKAELVQGFADIPEYRELKVENQINRAVKLAEEDWEKAKNIALGKEQPDYGLAPEAVFKAVEDIALEEGDVDLLRQLATSVRVSEATVMGQRIRLLAERNPDSAVTQIREITEARKRAIEKAKGYNIDKEVSKLKKEVDSKVKNIGKGDWKSFIDSIEC